jgi:hypothetical protein
MTDDASTAVPGLAGGVPNPVGSFVYSVPEDRWWWSDGLYLIHGFDPGAIVPTTALLLSHHHPNEVDSASHLIKRALRNGEPFTSYHRIVDARKQVRNVLVVGRGERNDAGDVTEVRGYMVDLTESRREDTAQDARDAVAGALAHRAVIEQAKGILISCYGLTADGAFTVLSARSQKSNTKVHAIAREVAAAAEGVPPAELRPRIDRILSRFDR